MNRGGPSRGSDLLDGSFISDICKRRSAVNNVHKCAEAKREVLSEIVVKGCLSEGFFKPISYTDFLLLSFLYLFLIITLIKLFKCICF